MIFKVTRTLWTTYDDGAGNTGKYTYTLVSLKEITIATKSIWVPHLFNFDMPKATLTALVADSLTVTLGAPPAFGGRTVTITTSGVVTLLASEALYCERIKIELVDVLDHAYTKMYVLMQLPTDAINGQVLLNGVLLQTVPLCSAGSVEQLEVLFVDTGDYLQCYWFFSAADISNHTISEYSVMVAENTLMTREYDGRMIEGGLKLGIVGLQVAQKELSGAVAQIAQYIRHGASMLELQVPTETYSLPAGIA